MPRVLFSGVSVGLFAGLVACAGQSITEADHSREVLQIAQQVPDAPTAKIDDYLSGIGLEEPSELSSDLVDIGQVDDQTAASSAYAFTDIEGEHPCFRDPEAECPEETRRFRTQALGRGGRQSDDNALRDLQALTPDIIDPDSFDPAQTAREIGRSGIPQSQAALSLGNALLTPPPPVEEEPDPGIDGGDVEQLIEDGVISLDLPGVVSPQGGSGGS